MNVFIQYSIPEASTLLPQENGGYVLKLFVLAHKYYRKKSTPYLELAVKNTRLWWDVLKISLWMFYSLLECDWF